MSAFTKTVDTRILGRKTYEASLRLGARFDKGRTIVFSSHAPPPDVPAGVEFVNGAIGPFVTRSRTIWQERLVDGRRRSHRLLSRRAGDRRVRHQCGAGVHRGWHSTYRAASPSRAIGVAFR